MKWIFITAGLVAGYLGTVNIFVSLFHHLPYAKRLSKTHNLMKAQRIDGKLDIWYGPVPYGRIFFGPLLFGVIFALIWLAVYKFAPNHHADFIIGVGVAMVINLIGLPDPKGRFKRDFNKLYGDNYESQANIDGIFSLQDEQNYLDSKNG